MLDAGLKAVDVLGLGEAETSFAYAFVGTLLVLGRSLRVVVCEICWTTTSNPKCIVAGI